MMCWGTVSAAWKKKRYILEYKAYCDYVFAHDEMDRDGAFYDSRLFQVGLYHVSGLVMLLTDRDLKLPDREALWESCSERFLSFIRSFPRTRNLSYVDSAIKDNLQELMPYLPGDAQDFQYVIEVTVARNPTTLLHGMLVRKIVLRILKTVLNQRPELLAGIFDNTASPGPLFYRSDPPGRCDGGGHRPAGQELSGGEIISGAPDGT